LDDHTPGSISVNITGLGVFVLNEVDALDINYVDGKSYYRNIFGFAIGSYSFHFAANDGIGNWTESSILPFDVINRAPVISLEQVSPNTGNTDTRFNFTITYTDLDNHAPAFIRLNITGVGVYGIAEIDSQDVDYTDGKEYYLNISGFAVALYDFSFTAQDALGNQTNTIIHQFNVTNRQPILTLENVNPQVGFAQMFYNFSVTYTDSDNHLPDIIFVNITNRGVRYLFEVDSNDTDCTDGKEYYYNMTLSTGSYSFHFTANDSLGMSALDTPEFFAPVVSPIPGVLYAINCTKDFSDEIFLNATLLDGGNNPISDESIAFYIDLNQNDIYEPLELIGSALTLADGSISIIYNGNLTVGSYNITAVYTGSQDYIVEDNVGYLIIDPKPAFLSIESAVVDVGETVLLDSMLVDKDGNPIGNEQILFFIDKDRDGIYESNDFIVPGTTSSNGSVSIYYYIDLIPNNYGILARYTGSPNYNVTEIEGLLTVQITGNRPPTIRGSVPHQIMPEDSLPWTLYLTPYEDDIEDSGSYLKWYLTGVDTSLYTVTGMNSSNDLFTFILRENAFGSDEVILWLWDSDGEEVFQVLWINITPVNDLPYFDPIPPDLTVHYDDPSDSDDDPSPWDYTFYVHDIETAVGDLIITTSEPTVGSGNGYAEVDGLNVTFHYPQSMVGENIHVTLSLSDGTDTVQTIITVNVTSDWVPELVLNLPDIVLEENTTLYNVFDLDDYFSDRDSDSLFFSSGYNNIEIIIHEDNTVDITALGEWTGTEYVTFRAQDPMGAISEDTITVTVTQVNDPPTISGVPDLVVHFDYSYGFDLSPYILDPDNLTSELIVWTSESQEYIILQRSDDVRIIVTYPESMNGSIRSVTIYVSDGIEIASQQINISVTSDFPPELVYYLPNVFFEEDEILYNAFNLGDYFFDFDQDILYYTNGTNYINVSVNENHTVDFWAPPNWYGFEILTFRATDPTGGLAEDKILVIVVPVNDAPTIASIPTQERDEGDEWILDLSEFIDDVDNDASELTITVESEAGFGYVKLVGNLLIFQYPEDVHEDLITITVSDGELDSSRSFIVNIQSSRQIAPSIWDLIPWHWVFSILTISIGGAFVIYKKWSSYRVYEAFLIHEKGLPIAIATKGKNSDLEDVMVSGMFTAVQDFINNAFSEKTSSESWELDEMKFGVNKILIERSEPLFLAVIFGGNSRKLRIRTKKLLENIDKEYGMVFEDWYGDMSELMGLRDMVGSLISSKPRKEMPKELKPMKPQLDTPQLVSDDEEIEEALLVWDSEKDEIIDELNKLADSHKEVVIKDVSSDDLVAYECPICGKEIKVQDSKCSRCGIVFVEMEDITNFPPNKPGDNRLK
jgi:hypothetical protein